MGRSGIPGAAGIGAIIVGLVVVGEAITLVTGAYSHWPFLALAIVVSLMAVHSINKRG